MKKFFAIAALFAVAAISLTSCGGDDPLSKYRIKSVAYTEEKDAVAADWEDKWTYNYDKEGKLVNMTRGAGQDARTYDFTYEGTSVKMDYVEPGWTCSFTLTLDENGRCVSMADDWDTFTFVYDANGYLTQIKKGDEVKSNITVDKDGNITKWSKFDNGQEKFKMHTYGKEKNVGGIHNIYAEVYPLERQLAETGLFGKATTNLCISNQWDYSQNASELNYEFDEETGFVSAERKNFPTDPDYTTIEIYKYTWEERK